MSKKILLKVDIVNREVHYFRALDRGLYEKCSIKTSTLLQETIWTIGSSDYFRVESKLTDSLVMPFYNASRTMNT